MTAHQYTDALPVTPSGGTFDPNVVDVTTGYDDAENAPPGITLTSGFRALWYTYVPSATANAGLHVIAVDAAGMNVYPFTATIWQVSSGTWTQTGEIGSSDSWAIQDPWPVTAGVRMYVRLASSNPAVGKFRLVVVNAPDAGTESGGAGPADPRHQYTGAITVAPSGGAYDSTRIDVSSGFDTAQTAPPGVTLPSGSRALWFTYVPAQTASAHLEAIAADTADMNVFSITATVWQVSFGTWTQVAQVTNTGWAVINPWSVTAGVRTYVQLVSVSTVGKYRVVLFSAPNAGTETGGAGPGQTISLPAIGAQTATHGHLIGGALAMPPIAALAAGHGHLVGPVDVITWPPIAAGVSISHVIAAQLLVAPPIAVAASLKVRAVEASITLTSPVEGDVIATDTPDFVVGLLAHNETLTYTIEVEYGDPADPSHTVTLSHSAAVVDGGAILTPTDPVPAVTRWRARLLLDGQEELSWTDWLTFTVDTAVETATLELTWTVAVDAERPIHVWHLDPPGPEVGESVTIYGHGFPGSGHLFLGGTELDIQSWELVAASAEATTAERQINGDIVDPEHFEIVFTAPAVDGPGAALIVEA